MREMDQSLDSRGDYSHGIKLGASKEEIIVKWSINHFHLYYNCLAPKFDRECNENSMRCEQMSIKCLEDSL
jgi:RecA-family ATPase